MNFIKDTFDNKYVALSVTVLLILYGYMLSRIGLPKYMQNLFNNTIFRIIFLSLLLIYNFDSSPSVALLVAIGFVMTIQYLSKQEMDEAFLSIEQYQRNDQRNDQQNDKHI